MMIFLSLFYLKVRKFSAFKESHPIFICHTKKSCKVIHKPLAIVSGFFYARKLGYIGLWAFLLRLWHEITGENKRDMLVAENSAVRL